MSEQKDEEILSVEEQAKALIDLVKKAKDDTSKRRAAVSFMVSCDTILNSPKIGKLMNVYGKLLLANGIDHKKIIAMVSPISVTAKQKHYVKTMAIIITSTLTKAGREQIKKTGLNYQEIEQVIGSNLFGNLKNYLSGE
jgi:hypothetical protein